MSSLPCLGICLLFFAVVSPVAAEVQSEITDEGQDVSASGLSVLPAFALTSTTAPTGECKDCLPLYPRPSAEIVDLYWAAKEREIVPTPGRGGFALLTRPLKKRWRESYPVVAQSSGANWSFLPYERERSGWSWWDSVEFTEGARTVRLVGGAADGEQFGCLRWSPDSKKLAFISKNHGAHRLMIYDIALDRVSTIGTRPINMMVTSAERDGCPFIWSSDSAAIMFAQVGVYPMDIGDFHSAISHPRVEDSYIAPSIAVKTGSVSPDLEATFDKLTSVQLVKAEIGSRRTYPLGGVRNIDSFSFSPQTIRYSLTTWTSAKEAGVRQLWSGLVQTSDVSAEAVGIISSASKFRWRNDNELEAVSARDGRFCFTIASFGDLTRHQKSCLDDKFADVFEGGRWTIGRSSDGRGVVYRDGIRRSSFVAKGLLPYWRLATDVIISAADDRATAILVSAPPEDRTASAPLVIATLDLNSGSVVTAWTSDQQSIQYRFKGMISDKVALMARESRLEPVKFVLVNIVTGSQVSIASFGDSFPAFPSLRRKDVSTTRPDGVPLRAEIIYPVDDRRKKGGKYPLLIWQYPIQAAKLDEIPKIFPTYSDSEFRPNSMRYVGGWLPLMMLADGYAVMHYPDFPLIGSDGGDFGTYNAQNVESARALVSSAVLHGEIDEKRIAISGHSRGGGNAAGLLADTKLFAAGVSIGGALNLTGLQFGLQYHDKSIWRDPQAYFRNSPAFRSDQIDAPLLIVTGERDTSPTDAGTAWGAFASLREIGKPVRYVELPMERHEPVAAESQLFVLKMVQDLLEAYLN